MLVINKSLFQMQFQFVECTKDQIDGFSDKDQFLVDSLLDMKYRNVVNVRIIIQNEMVYFFIFIIIIIFSLIFF